MGKFSFAYVVFLLLFIATAYGQGESARVVTSFDDGWLFLKHGVQNHACFQPVNLQPFEFLYGIDRHNAGFCLGFKRDADGLHGHRADIASRTHQGMAGL